MAQKDAFLLTSVSSIGGVLVVGIIVVIDPTHLRVFNRILML
jgi:hypothetical protein